MWGFCTCSILMCPHPNLYPRSIYPSPPSDPPTPPSPGPTAAAAVAPRRAAPQMGLFFWCAVALALERLPAVLQRRLESAFVEVCVYRRHQVKMFEDALREKYDRGGFRLPVDWGELRMHDGSRDWVRQRNHPRDCFMRLTAASMSLRAVWEQGYVFL